MHWPRLSVVVVHQRYAHLRPSWLHQAVRAVISDPIDLHTLLTFFRPVSP